MARQSREETPLPAFAASLALHAGLLLAVLWAGSHVRFTAAPPTDTVEMLITSLPQPSTPTASPEPALAAAEPPALAPSATALAGTPPPTDAPPPPSQAAPAPIPPDPAPVVSAALGTPVPSPDIVAPPPASPVLEPPVLEPPVLAPPVLAPAALVQPEPSLHTPPRSSPKPVRPRAAPPVSRQSAPDAKATATPAPAAPQALASAAPPALASAAPPAPQLVASNAGLASWRNALGSWLAEHKRYPEAARREGEEGVVGVAFTVARDGRVISVVIARSSGSAALDRAVREMLEGQRLPPFPPDMMQTQEAIRVNIRYRLDR